MSRILVLIFILQFGYFTEYCTDCRYKSGRNEYYEIYQIPYEKESERIEKLLSYPVETQIDIYLYASSCNEDYRIKGIFNETAENKVLDIAERIKNTTDEKDKMNLIWALLYIDYKCRCVKNNSEVIKIVTASQNQVSETDSASEKHYKEMYEKALKSLKNE